MLKSIVMVGAAAAVTLMPGAAQARASAADQAFLTQDVQGGRYELALAKLGMMMATKPAIRQYSQMVVRDHTSANAVMATLARTEGVNPPAGMTDQDSARLAKLRGMKASAFDQAYIAEQNRINSEDEQAAAKEKSSTRDAAIKAYLVRFAAMDAKHKRMAEALKNG